MSTTIDVEVVVPEVAVEVVVPEVAVEVVDVTIEVETSGPPGPRGKQGAPGPPGGAGYVHTQSMLAKVWTVAHNLGRHPAVSTEDAVGNVTYGSVKFLDDNTLTITFASTTTGRANCT